MISPLFLIQNDSVQKTELGCPITCVKLHSLYHCICGMSDGSTRIINTLTGKELARFQLPATVPVEHIVVAPAINKLLIGLIVYFFIYWL